MPTVNPPAGIGQVAINSIVAGSLETLEAGLVLAGTVWRDASTAFVGGVGTTVEIRKPSVFIAKKLERGGSTVAEPLNEDVLPITLTDHVYHRADLDSWARTLEVENFARQVTVPQVDAVARDLEAKTAAMLQSRIDADDALAYDGTSPFSDVLIEADKRLNEAHVPAEGRFLVVSPALRAAILKDPLLVRTDQIGDSDAVVRGSLGKRFGFTVLMSTFVDGAVVYVRDGFALASRVPEPLYGVAAGSLAKAGYALRLTLGADIDRLADVSTLDTFVGTKVLDPARSVGITVSGGDAPAKPRVDSATLS